jgi:hypothetical protein
MSHLRQFHVYGKGIPIPNRNNKYRSLAKELGLPHLLRVCKIRRVTIAQIPVGGDEEEEFVRDGVFVSMSE